MFCRGQQDLPALQTSFNCKNTEEKSDISSQAYPLKFLSNSFVNHYFIQEWERASRKAQAEKKNQTKKQPKNPNNNPNTKFGGLCNQKFLKLYRRCIMQFSTFKATLITLLVSSTKVYQHCQLQHQEYSSPFFRKLSDYHWILKTFYKRRKPLHTTSVLFLTQKFQVFG